MNHAVRYLRRVVIVFAALGAIGWGGWMEMASREPPAAAPTYSVGGTLSGLESEKSLVITNNGTDNLALSANGTFAFPTPLANSAAYAVTVVSQPAGQTCTVSHASGAISAQHVTQVNIECVATPPTTKALFQANFDPEDSVAAPRNLSTPGPGAGQDVMGTDA